MTRKSRSKGKRYRTMRRRRDYTLFYSSHVTATGMRGSLNIHNFSAFDDTDADSHAKKYLNLMYVPIHCKWEFFLLRGVSVLIERMTSLEIADYVREIVASEIAVAEVA